MTNERLARIFGDDGRTVIIALDHGLIDGPCPGFEQPASTISSVVAGGADAILTSYGIARNFADELDGVGLILRSDGASSNLGSPSTGSTGSFFGPDDAVRVGADALVATALPGSDKEDMTLENLARTASAAHALGIPMLGEMVPGGFDSPPGMRGTEAVAFAARLGAELGADFIKAPYCADYAKVTSSTFVPVVILGGSKTSETDMLTDIRSALDSGAAGVAIGRNVFQAPDPTAMTAAIVALVHDDASVDQALAVLNG